MGKDINKLKPASVLLTTKQVFAVTVGSMSAITALLLGLAGILFQYRTVAVCFVWEWILVVLWAAMTGIFMGMYRKENAEGDHNITEMKTASAFDA